MMHTMRSQIPRCLAVSVVLISLAQALGAQNTAWKTYSYPADGLSVAFPAEPSIQKNNVPTDAGTFELRAYLVEVGEAALYVGVCDYGSAAANRNPDTVLNGAQQGAIDNVKAHLINGKTITLGTYPGREFEAENDTMHFTARIYLVGTTLYQTLTAAPIKNPYAGNVRFLDSFQLIARVKP
jgi:hypothetical protein